MPQKPVKTADDILDIAQVSKFLGVKEGRARRLVVKAQLTPVRTPAGIGYQSDEVRALAHQMRSVQ